ncbi:major histocompatibility complex class I-related gene protein-like [Thunnus maccoyii]|uniref:major histocompatibility complex class I-related gene protein-like n=1 Tax=Thunnus maccoyii TaxID=8240 RepID=UPI001C4B1E2A|nr:major histocompatibility complex class I-related gene protein-like [Thunnus maccoyii]
MLLLFCHVASTVKYSLTFSVTVSSGVPNIPHYIGILNIDEVQMTYLDSNIKRSQPRQDWVKKLMEDDPQHWEINTQNFFQYQQLFKVESDTFKQSLNQTAGVQIDQLMFGCEWDDETEKVDGHKKYGYNGEDVLTFDPKTETWITATPQAAIAKQKWDGNKASNGFWKNFLITICPTWLKNYLKVGKRFLQRKELPSVSLLQKTPSSPVSCHTTGFYPHRADMFWSKDEEELHEDMERGEILPNHDGSFQMSVDLNLSSVTPEEWSRYKCVFQLSGVNDNIITKLDKAVIRTNWGKNVIRNDKEKPSNVTIPIIATLVVLAAVIIAVTGFIVYKKKKAKSPPPSPDNSTELSEKLNPET